MAAFREKIESTHRKLFPSGAGAGAHAKASSMDFNISTAALEIIKGFFGGEPVLGVSVTSSIDALLAVLKDPKSNKESRTDLGQLNEHIMRLYNDVLEPVYYYQLHKGDQLSRRLSRSVQSLFDELARCANKCKENLSLGFLRVTFSQCNERALYTLSGEIKTIIDGFLAKDCTVMQLDMATLLHDSRVGLVSNLPCAKEATQNSSHINDIPICLKETRKDVLTKINKWRKRGDASTCKRLFWLNGIVGSGKTAIARTVIEEAKEDVWVASFFFSRGDAHSSNALLVFPTLAYQLALFHPKIMVSLSKVIREDKNCTSRPLEEQFTQFIEGPLKALNDRTRTILLVLDAIDECSGAHDILQLFLTRATAVPCNLRIFITSRPEKYIRSLFTGGKKHVESALHEIERATLNGDIKRFLQHRLEDSFGRRHLPIPGNNDIERLVQQVDGLFILAASFLRFIDSNLVDDPMVQLDIILKNCYVPGRNPHSTIDSLYLQVLDMAVPTTDDSFEMLKTRFLHVVGTIVTLREPLPLSALAIFMGPDVKAHHIHAALRPLHSVIFVPPSSAKGARVHHQSFIDFITEKSRCRDDRFFINVPYQETLHASRCLAVMTNSLKYNMVGMDSRIRCNSEVVDLDNKVKKAILGELKYACMHWVSHIVAASDTEKFMSQLSNFIRNCLLYWMEAMSLLGKVPHAISMMKNICTWSVKIRLDHELNKLLNDGLQRLLQHQNALIHYALHVYNADRLPCDIYPRPCRPAPLCSFGIKACNANCCFHRNRCAQCGQSCNTGAV